MRFVWVTKYTCLQPATSQSQSQQQWPFAAFHPLSKVTLNHTLRGDELLLLEVPDLFKLVNINMFPFVCPYAMFVTAWVQNFYVNERWLHKIPCKTSFNQSMLIKSVAVFLSILKWCVLCQPAKKAVKTRYSTYIVYIHNIFI